MRTTAVTLADLLDSDAVWIAGALGDRPVGHRDERRTGTADCGVSVEPTPVGAYRLRDRGGRLCPVCWGSGSRWPHPRRAARNRRAVEAERVRQAVNRSPLPSRRPQDWDFEQELRRQQAGTRWTR